MAFVHTAHGLGRIVATETLRGRTRHKVAGAGFEVWLDAAQVREASLGDVNEDNSTTLPYDPTPQYPSDMWAHDTTIQPGEQEIDAEERLSPSDSIDFASRSNRSFPGPDPALFAKNANFGEYDDAPFTGEGGTYNDYEGDDGSEPMFSQQILERNKRLRDQRVHEAGWSDDKIDKEAGIREWWQEMSKHPGEDEPLQVETAEEWLRNNPLSDEEREAEEDRQRRQRGKIQANLDSRYATWMLSAPEGDDSVSRFRRDPIQEINRLGYLWTGGVEEPGMAEYGRLVEADKMLREAAWTDVRQKAQRLRREGRVHVLQRGPGTIYANVEGDTGYYTTMIAKTGNTQSIDKWACSCEWGKWAFQRRISYVGRLCSHGYASYLEMQSDDHKGNPGRFHQPRRTASVVDDFQDYVNDFRDGHVDIDAADNFITLPEHSQQEDPFTEDQVADIYDWARDNATEREPRNYKMPYYTAAEGERAQVLRTHPMSLTPDLIKVPKGEEPHFVDVEEDERETTGPDGIMHTAALVDAMGNSYFPGGFRRTADDVIAGSEDENSAPVSDPSVATPRVPETQMSAPGDDEYSAVNGGSGGGGGLQGFMDSAMPVIDTVSGFAQPIAEGIGSALGNIGSGLRRSHRTADYDYEGPTNVEVPEGDLEHLRSLSDEEADLGHTDSQNREKAHLIDELREDGFDVSQIVASYGVGNQGMGQPGGAFLQPGGASWADRSFSGSGPDPKYWFGTSEGLIDRGDEDIEEVDVTEGDGRVNEWPQSERPAQGKKANRFLFASDDDMSDELLQSVGEEIEGIGQYGQFLDEAREQGDDEAAAAISEAMDDEADHVENFTDVLGHTAGYRLAGELHGEPDYDDWDGGRPAEKVEHRYEPDMEREGAMNDIVRRFQASGGGALNGDQGGNQSDDAIANQARKFLAKTAGRVYSLAEQRELVEESHPGGARNKPTSEDLAGTHYV